MKIPRSWQQFPNGLLLRNEIEATMKEFLSGCEGERLLAVGPLAHELNMASCKVKQRIRLDWVEGDFVDLVAIPEALPVDGDSIDILVLPLLLDYADDPQQILREAKRVVDFGGKICILSFNSTSLWSARHLLSTKNSDELWKARPISSHRLADWLQLLQFRVIHKINFGPMLPWKLSLNLVPDWVSGFKKHSNAVGGFQLIWAEKQVPVITPLQQRWKTFSIKGSTEMNVREEVEGYTQLSDND